MTRQDDPRYRRVRQRLVPVLLDMAATRAAEEISVSELTAAAGVSRASFYAHASSPAGLLADVLITELRPGLDAIADQMSHPNSDYVLLWRRIYLTLLTHVREHGGIYRVLSARESSVSSALTSYFEEAAGRYVHAIEKQLDGPPVTDLWRAMAVSQQAHNMLAVIRAWIVTGMVDPPDVVVDTYLTLAPPWQLAHADDQGLISLRRIRALSSRSGPAVRSRHPAPEAATGVTAGPATPARP